MSLARGLDYYTGIIYEAILLGKLGFFSSDIYLLKAIRSLTLSWWSCLNSDWEIDAALSVKFQTDVRLDFYCVRLDFEWIG